MAPWFSAVDAFTKISLLKVWISEYSNCRSTHNDERVGAGGLLQKLMNGRLTPKTASAVISKAT